MPDKEIACKTFDQCVFGSERKELAIFLTRFLAEEEGIVLNLNGEWGVGKTFFVRSWIDLIKDQYPAIYIDAWRTDFSEDPMIVVVDTILAFFKSANDVTNPDLEKKIIKSAGRLLSSSAKVGAGIATHLAGFGSNAGQDSVGAITNIVGEYFDLLPEAQFENYRQQKSAVDDFQILIEQWLKCYMESPKNEKSYPVFVFVDELDRCRPTYAIEMLEVIKHFFNMKDFVFVVSTDTGQLSESIKAVYGNGFNSRGYLSRFFNRTCSLSVPSYRQFCESKNTIKGINKYGVLLCCGARDLSDLFADICEFYKLKLREVEQAGDLIMSIIRYISHTGDNKVLNFSYFISRLVEIVVVN